MGLLEKYRERTQEKVDDARAKGEAKARGAGRAPGEVREAGEKAARRKRRRIRFSGYGGAGGTS